MNVAAVQETDWIENLPLQTHHILELLSKKGHVVTVVDFPAKWTSGRRGSAVSNLKTKTLLGVHRIYPDARVRLVRPGFVRLKGIDRLSAQLTQFLSIFRVMRDSDIVILYGVPTNGWQTIVSSKLLNKPVVFHSYDVLHEMTNHEMFRVITWALEGWVYRRVDHAMTISVALADYLRRLGTDTSRIKLVFPGVDTTRFSATVSGRTVRERFGLEEDAKVVLYSGWLYEFSGVDTVLRDFKMIMEKEPRARLLICGEGPLLNELRKYAAESGIEKWVKIVGRQPHRMMPEIIAASTVCINPYKPDIRAHYAFPSKVLEYLASGKPIVMSSFPGSNRVFPTESGVTITSPDNFSAALAGVLADERSLRSNGAKARNYAEEHFSFDLVVSQVEGVLSEVINSHLGRKSKSVRGMLK